MKNFVSRILVSYKNSLFSRIEAMLCIWILLLTLAAPKAELANFVPELWRPVFPFQALTLSLPVLEAALWFLRLSLLACLLLPRRATPLVGTFLGTFVCFGLCNCFWIEIQLFAPLVLLSFLLALIALDSKSNDIAASSRAPFAVKFVIVLLFFSAGLAKIRYAGLGWAFSDSIQDYFRALLPTNRDVLGLPVIIKLRTELLRHNELLAAGSFVVHLSELLIPLALFSKRASRFFGWFFLSLTIINFICFGINFLSIVPLLITWLVSDKLIQDVFPSAPMASRVAQTLIVLSALQISVTLFSDRNLWPVLINDMYAKPYPFPRFDDLQVLAVNKDGQERILPPSEVSKTLLKMHIFVALLRMNDEVQRTKFINKLFENYRAQVCTDDCDSVRGLRAVLVVAGKSELLAESSR